MIFMHNVILDFLGVFNVCFPHSVALG